MTSPNRETEAQQAEDQVEQKVHTRAKASLTIKREKSINLVVQEISSQEKAIKKSSDQEHQEKATAGILSPEMAIRKSLNPGEREVLMGITNQGHREVGAIISLEAQETGILNPGRQETETVKISNHVRPEPIKKVAQGKFHQEKRHAAI